MNPSVIFNNKCRAILRKILAFFGKIKKDNAELNTKKLTTEYCCRLLRTKKTQESHLIFCAAKKTS